MFLKFNLGDEVYWNDPDDDNCSDYYIIKDIDYENEVLFLENKFSETEAYFHEVN